VAVGRCHRHWSRGESGVSPLNAGQGIIRIGAQLSDGGRILVEVPPSVSGCIQPCTPSARPRERGHGKTNNRPHPIGVAASS